MKDYQKKFIQIALASGALGFGEFTLKSGRLSPYFFNAGRIYTGANIAKLGECFAAAIKESKVSFDMIFGPAYKGIPLATTTAVALAKDFGKDSPVCFNRKESKDHGEGGQLIGAPLQNRVLIIDDVITAGTAIREVLNLLSDAGAQPAAIVVGLDRQERGQGKHSAIEEIEQETGVDVISIIRLADIIQFMSLQDKSQDTLVSLKHYRDTYGV